MQRLDFYSSWSSAAFTSFRAPPRLGQAQQSGVGTSRAQGSQNHCQSIRSRCGRALGDGGGKPYLLVGFILIVIIVMILLQAWMGGNAEL